MITRKRRFFSKSSIYFIVLLMAILFYLVYLVFISYINHINEHEILISIFSWLGILLLVFIIWTWHQLTGQVFTLYTIFVLFFFLFNFGQPLMWAVGIHHPDEIGVGNLYLFGKATTGNILFTQALTLISIFMFHLGAVFCHKPKRAKIQDVLHKVDEIDNDLSRKSLYYTAIALSFVVIPVSLYISIFNLYYAQLHGYSALYYDPNKPSSSLLGVIHYMFLPTLFGLLIGSNYRRRVKYFVYFSFIIYLIINLLSGDRGSWIYGLIFLLYLSHRFYKEISFRKFFVYSFIGLFFLYIISAIVQLRNKGISIESIIEVVSLEEFPIISFIFEMGSSMQPALVLIQYGWDIWPYSNSYLMAIMGVVSTRIFALFEIPFGTIGSWFSQEYLGISYGAGFSIVAEALLNYGPIISPLFMIILGYLISSLTYMDKSLTIKSSPFRVFIAVSTMASFIKIARGDLHHILKSWFFGVVLFIIAVFLVREVLKKKVKSDQRRYVEGICND